VDRGDLHLVPGRADAQVRVGAGGIDLEDPPHHLLPEQDPGLGQRRAGRGDRARFHRQAGHRERPGQDQVIPLIREQGADDDGHRGHLRSQRPVQLVPMLRLRCRPGDDPVRKQFRDQARPAQFPEQVLPEPRTGRSLRQQALRDRRTRIASTLTSGNSGRSRKNHGKMARQTKLLGTMLMTRHHASYQGLCCIHSITRPTRRIVTNTQRRPRNRTSVHITLGS
jgi:hypothetical protein